jgi:uncharacterized coiled-coil DUF342 family protein
MNEMMEKVANFNTKFNKDPKVRELIEELETRYKELFNESFSPEEVVSDEFDEMANDYYEMGKESDPDEVDIFDVLWYNL